MVVTADPRISALAKKLRNQGPGDSNDWLQHEELGYNYRISEMNCALGIDWTLFSGDAKPSPENVSADWKTSLPEPSPYGVHSAA
jgi:hypothetical protein